MGFTKETITKDRTIYGALFENMVIVDFIKNFNNQGLRPNLSFLRDSNQNEIDLIVELGNTIIPIEIKASQTINNSSFKTLNWFQEQTKSKEPVVVYGGDHNQTRTKGKAVSWNKLNALIKKLRGEI
jgi:predicted AAA+ superfamily ATPase